MLKRFPQIFICLLALCSCDQDDPISQHGAISERDTTQSEKVAAFEEVNELLRDNINNPSLYMRRAELFLEYGDVISALKDLDRGLVIDSTATEFYLLKAKLLKDQDKFKQAKEVLDKCMMVDNSNIEARLELGWLALVAQNHKQALDYADAILKMDIHHAEAYFLKGMIFQDMRDTTLAISSFSTAIEQENDYYEAYMQLGLLHFNEPNTLAKEYLKNALRIKPKSTEALYAFALLCQERGEYNESIENYHKIVKISKFREPYFNLGYIHQEYLKVYDVAIDYYTEAIEIEPMYIEAYYNRALCNMELRNYKESEKDLRKALELDPQYTDAAIMLERVINFLS